MQTSFKLTPTRLSEIYLYKQSRGLFLLSLVFLFISCQKDGPGREGDGRNCYEFKKEKKSDKHEENAKPTVSVFATGFNNPRGLKFGPACYL